MQDKHLLLVSYTLYPPQQDEALLELLEKADSYELDDTAWLICTADSAGYWYSRLERTLFPEDELIVLKVDIQDIGGDEGVKADLQAWLKSRFPQTQ
ncbi:MAG: hypothetical protein SF029_16100 [bacterium]|nr:hypothetical protein [bacterium]